MFQLPLGPVSHFYLTEDFLETHNSIFVKLGGGVGLGTGLIKDPNQGFPKELRAVKGKGGPFPLAS